MLQRQRRRRRGVRAGVALMIAVLGVAACGGTTFHTARIPTLTSTQIFDRAGDGTVQILGKEGSNTVAGTGFVIDDKNKFIITNAHVVAAATSLYARTAHGERFPVRVYAENLCEDVAVLQAVGAVPARLKALPLGSSSDLRPGQPTTILGFAGTLQHIAHTSLSTVTGSIGNPNVTHGTIIKSLPTYSQLLEVDAAVNPGNSGGPVLDQQGEVIGMATLHNIGFGGDAVSNQGFAIPSDRIRRLLAQLRAGHSSAAIGWDLTAYSELSVTDVIENDPDYGWRGPGFADAVERFFHRLHVNGVYVDNVEENSAAAKAHIYYGEVIETIDNTPVHSVGDVCTAILSKSPGDVVSVTGRVLNSGSHVSDIGLEFYDRLKIPQP
jgi:S1-C subfamily serine protease